MQQAADSEVTEGGMANVDLEQALEEPRVALQDVEGAITQARGTVHQKQGAGHEGGKTLDAAVGLLVGDEVVVAEGGGEGSGLAEAQS